MARRDIRDTDRWRGAGEATPHGRFRGELEVTLMPATAQADPEQSQEQGRALYRSKDRLNI